MKTIGSGCDTRSPISDSSCSARVVISILRQKGGSSSRTPTTTHSVCIRFARNVLSSEPLAHFPAPFPKVSLLTAHSSFMQVFSRLLGDGTDVVPPAPDAAVDHRAAQTKRPNPGEAAAVSLSTRNQPLPINCCSKMGFNRRSLPPTRTVWGSPMCGMSPMHTPGRSNLPWLPSVCCLMVYTECAHVLANVEGNSRG